MSRGRILAAVIVLPIAVYAGYKLWVRHSVKVLLDQVTATARPFASVRYQSLSSSFWSGSVAIDGIQIRPNGFSEDLKIRTVEMRAGGPLDLLAASGRLRKGEAPQALTVALRGIDLKVDGALYGAMEHWQNRRAPARRLAHCGNITAVGARELRAMGYDQVSMDVAVSYVQDHSPDQLTVKIDGRARDMVAIGGELTLAGAPETWRLAPNLTSARLAIKDLSYIERLKQFCTKASNITDAAYVDAEVNQPDAVYRAQWGFVPGAGLRAAYRQYLEKPGELVVEMRPGGIDPRLLDFYRPADVLAMLKPELRVNGHAVTDLSYTREPVTTREPAVSVASVLSGARQLWQTPDAFLFPDQAQADSESYRAVRVSELPKYIGKQVRLRLPKGVLREGTLKEANPSLITVARDYGRGDMRFEVLTKQVEKAEVRD